MPLVSVIIPAWRAEPFVANAIASARAQSLSDLQIIVVDDASPDGTSAAALRAAGQDGRVELVRHDGNLGPSAARNTALERARGTWVAVLDADDTMAPTRLATLLRYAEEAGADIVADDLVVTGSDQSCARHLNNKQVEQIDLAAFVAGNLLFNGDRARGTGYLKPMFKRDFLVEHGLRYDPQVRIGEDYLLVASALALGARYVVAPEALYRYHVRAGSTSWRMSLADIERLIAADERFAERFGAAMAAPVRTALKRRRASLEDGAAFAATVAALKQRRMPEAAASALRRPASLRHFGMPIAARWARLTRRGAS